MAPATASPERPAYLQWLLFAEKTLDPLVVAELQGPAPSRTRLDEVRRAR